MHSRWESLAQELEYCDSKSGRFFEIFEELKELASRGICEACEMLGEMQSLDPVVYDLEAAYVWYYIALKSQGYSVAYRNEGSGNAYVGPEGDFRNEPMVADLVERIGLERIKILDSQAEAWFSRNREDKALGKPWGIGLADSVRSQFE